METKRAIPTWRPCKTHGDEKPNVYGCADCVREMREELAALRKDAERYRWLRDTKRLYLGPLVSSRRDNHGERHILASTSLGYVQHDVDSLDKAVDAMIAKQR